MKKKVSAVLLRIVLIIMAVYTLFPIAFLVINSFKSQSAIVDSPMALPGKWSFSYLASALEQIHFVRAFGVTLFITGVSVAILVVAASWAAWMMVRNKTKRSALLFLMFTSAMLIPFQSVMYPLLSMFDQLQLRNLGGLIIMYCGFGLSMSVFLYHGFLKSIPQSLEEAAAIDGANIFQMFFQVVFPLLKSTTVTVIILNGIWIWNDYLLPFLTIGNSNYKTLTLELYFAKMVSGQYSNAWELIFPAVLVTIIPIIIVYLFLQKYIMKGIADGAVKG